MKEEVINQELDKDQWKLEAQAIINDVKQHVMDIKVSEKLQNSNQFFYLNLITLENLKFCIELSNAGFTIVVFNPNLAEDIRVTVIYKICQINFVMDTAIDTIL